MERQTQLKCKIPLWRKLLGRVRRHGQQGNKNVKYGHPAFQADAGIKCGSKPPPFSVRSVHLNLKVQFFSISYTEERR